MNPAAMIATQGLLVACSTCSSLETVLLKYHGVVTPVLILRYFTIGKHSRGPVNEFRGDNCFCLVDQGEGSLPGSSIRCHSEVPENYRQILDPVPPVLLQRIESPCLESTKHFSVRPLSLSIAPGLCHRGK